MLENHVIVDVTHWQVRTRYPRFHANNAKIPAHGYGHSELSMLEVVTDKGASGFGMGKFDRLIYQSLVGKRVSEVFDPAFGIKSPVYYNADIALHDLAGKILGVSVKKMINPNALDRIECYDGSIYQNDLFPPKAPGGVKSIIDNCKWDVENIGFKDFKVKIGREKWLGYEAGLARDIDIIKKIREEFPTARILVDANDSYTVDTAIKFMEATKNCDIYWFEEPFCEEEEPLRIFRQYLKENSPHTLIADGEWAPRYFHTAETVGHVENLAKIGLVDVLLMDTVDFGFTNWRQYMKRVAEIGVLASPHNWANTMKTCYASHLAAAFPELVPTIEGVGDTTEGIDHSLYFFEDGLLNVPDAPGFGMELIWARRV